MKGNWKEYKKKKHQFSSYYCSSCHQQKPCYRLGDKYCCSCSYELEQARAKDYLTYEKAWETEKRASKEHHQNLQQLLTGKTLEQKADLADWKKFYQQKSWGINLTEWLTSKRVLPVDYHCSQVWQKDKGHLPEKCDCLARKARELHIFLTNSLKESKTKLASECKCETSQKVRVFSDYATNCQGCEQRIIVASKKRMIKNRNDPQFWGLKVKEKVLCGDCLADYREQMPQRKKYLFSEYGKRGYWRVKSDI